MNSRTFRDWACSTLASLACHWTSLFSLGSWAIRSSYCDCWSDLSWDFLNFEVAVVVAAVWGSFVWGSLIKGKIKILESWNYQLNRTIVWWTTYSSLFSSKVLASSSSCCCRFRRLMYCCSIWLLASSFGLKFTFHTQNCFIYFSLYDLQVNL